MNYRLVINQLGLLLVLLSAMLLLLAGFSFVLEYQIERSVSADAATALASVGLGGLLIGALVWFSTRMQESQMGRREAMLLVAASWVGGAAFAALPFFVWAHLSDDQQQDSPFRNFVNCYFETMSGLTTAGSSILSDVEVLPKSLLLWRASLHWLGGLGIVVLFVAVLPSLGVVGKKLYRVEAGTSRQGLQPQIRQAARALWYIYLGLTIAQITLMWLFGMSYFDSICHTFATIATGGFSTKNASIGAYADNHAIVITIIVFMILGSLNFGLYNHLLRRRFSLVLQDVELRLFLFMLVAAIGIVAITVALAGDDIQIIAGEKLAPTAYNATLHSAFNVTSVQSTTGFGTIDYAVWPFLAQAIMLVVIFVGGCSGSTAGGIKVIRVWIVMRVMLAEIERVFRPNVIRPVRIGGSVVEPELKQAALVYVLGAILIIGTGAVLVMLSEQIAPNPDVACSFKSAATGTLACFSTTGPGLDMVGPAGNYAWLNVGSKLILSLVMLLGRLEVFAIIVLFSPRFWRND